MSKGMRLTVSVQLQLTDLRWQSALWVVACQHPVHLTNTQIRIARCLSAVALTLLWCMVTMTDDVRQSLNFLRDT